MRERVEFRVPEEHAAKHLPPGLGERLGYGVRKLIVDTSDPLFLEIGRLHRRFREEGRYFFSGREYYRDYSEREMLAAELLHVWPTRVFEPAGEECGTEYDESVACPECGAGAKQATDLRLDLRKVPRGVDFAETIAAERVVSQRFAECLVEAGAKGVELRRVAHRGRPDDSLDLTTTPSGRALLARAERAAVRHSAWQFSVWMNRAENRPLLDAAVAESGTQQARTNRPVPLWYQLVVTSPRVEVDSLTRAGADPFDEDRTGACPHGDVVGLNLLSEVTVRRATLPEADVMETRQMIGVRRGLLRPRPLLLLSARAWRAVSAAGIRGLSVEVAHAV